MLKIAFFFFFTVTVHYDYNCKKKTNCYTVMSISFENKLKIRKLKRFSQNYSRFDNFFQLSIKLTEKNKIFNSIIILYYLKKNIVNVNCIFVFIFAISRTIQLQIIQVVKDWKHQVNFSFLECQRIFCPSEVI